jgi:hypothetical protein
MPVVHPETNERCILKQINDVSFQYLGYLTLSHPILGQWNASRCSKSYDKNPACLSSNSLNPMISTLHCPLHMQFTYLFPFPAQALGEAAGTGAWIAAMAAPLLNCHSSWPYRSRVVVGCRHCEAQMEEEARHSYEF